MFSKNRGRPSKYISISNELSKYIRSGELADGSPMPSERKLAKLFDCTQVTLRKALKHLESEKMIYSVPYKGRFVGMKNSAMREKSNLAALIFPDDELFYYKIFSRLEPFFQENGQLLSVHITGNSETKERKLLEMFEAKNFDVVVAVPNPACRDIYAAGKMPTVFFDSVLEKVNISGVVSDDRNGAYQAVRHLLSLGHKRIAFIGHDYDLSGRNRLDGYFDALNKAHLEIVPELIKLQQPSREWGIYAMSEMFKKRDKRPTAVFCVNDTVASGVMYYAHSHHIEIPHDLSVLSFGNTGIAEDLDLSSVDQNLDKIVDAIKLKVQQCSMLSECEASNITVPCSLIVRSSSGICMKNERN
ncbi:MAG: GntR family transcriptional regulator [Lentisphaeria bacterium]|nr:GntR family transcriptional regulator [Lentisphaeria bacterium]